MNFLKTQYKFNKLNYFSTSMNITGKSACLQKKKKKNQFSKKRLLSRGTMSKSLIDNNFLTKKCPRLRKHPMNRKLN